MITWLNVPFAERGAAKALGARWSPGNKRWYVEDTANISAYMRWMPAHLKKPAKATLQKKATPPCLGDILRKNAGKAGRKRARREQQKAGQTEKSPHSQS